MTDYKTFVKRIGAELRRQRHQSGLTLQQVAYASGLSLSFLSDVERGRTPPSIKTLFALAGVYRVSSAEIVAAGEMKR